MIEYPCDFVMWTFVEQGFTREKLAQHQYGFDERGFYPDSKQKDGKRGLTILFAGGSPSEKGLHYALEFWL